MYSLKLTLLISLFITTACAQNKTATPTAVAEKPATLAPRQTPSLVSNFVSIRYIANMGVLVSGGGKQVLIDAIHQKYKPTYLFPPPDVLRAMETGAAPFDKIDLILVTHNHLDHFHARSTMLHLKNNQMTTAVVPEQIFTEMSALPEFEALKPRVIKAPNSPLSGTIVETGGMKITLFDLKHINPQHSGIQNTGYLIEIGDKKILHVGDAELTAENFEEFKLPEMKIDAAVLPVWFLNDTNSCSQVKKLIGAKHNIATHIPPAHAADYKQSLEKNSAGSIPFVTVGEEKKF